MARKRPTSVFSPRSCLRSLTGALALLIAAALVAGLAGCGVGLPGRGAGTPPAEPTGVTAAAGAGYVLVNWSHDGVNATGFAVYREAVGGAIDRATRRLREGAIEAWPPMQVLEASAAALELVAEVGPQARSLRDEDVLAGVEYRYGVVAKGRREGTSTMAMQAGDLAVPEAEGSSPGENPDPARYLAAVVTDFLGNAVAGARVVAVVVDASPDVPDLWVLRATSDDAGVALLHDLNDGHAPTGGSYQVFVTGVFPGHAPKGVVRTFAAVSIPGTIAVDPAAPALVDLRLDVTDEGHFGRHMVQFARGLDGGVWALGEIMDVEREATLLRVERASYDLVFTGWVPERGFHLWRSEVVASSGTLAFEATTAPAFEFAQAFDDPVPPGWVARTLVCPRALRSAVRWARANTACIDGTWIRFSPQQYSASHVVFFSAAASEEEWTHNFAAGPHDLTPAGASRTLTLGGEAVLDIAPLQGTHQPGHEVGFSGALQDGFGHEVVSIWHQPDGAAATNDLVDLEVTDPTGHVIHAASGWRALLVDPRENAFTLDEDAPPGVYTVRAWWDTGPYAGRLQASATFGVEGTTDDDSIAAYEIPPAVVALVTGIDGVVDGYEGGAVAATLVAGAFATGTAPPTDTVWRHRPWVPTEIAPDGSFAIALPDPPDAHGDEESAWCEPEVMWSLSGSIVVIDGALGEPGASLVAEYWNARIEAPAVPLEVGFDASLLVLYAYTDNHVDITCDTPFGPVEGSGFRFDVDLRLRHGWNVIHVVLRREDDEYAWYARTGQPGLPVSWIALEESD